jgi:hypothetical protein
MPKQGPKKTMREQLMENFSKKIVKAAAKESGSDELRGKNKYGNGSQMAAIQAKDPQDWAD